MGEPFMRNQFNLSNVIKEHMLLYVIWVLAVHPHDCYEFVVTEASPNRWNPEERRKLLIPMPHLLRIVFAGSSRLRGDNQCFNEFRSSWWEKGMHHLHWNKWLPKFTMKLEHKMNAEGISNSQGSGHADCWNRSVFEISYILSSTLI